MLNSSLIAVAQWVEYKKIKVVTYREPACTARTMYALENQFNISIP